MCNILCLPGGSPALPFPMCVHGRDYVCMGECGFSQGTTTKKEQGMEVP